MIDTLILETKYLSFYHVRRNDEYQKLLEIERLAWKQCLCEILNGQTSFQGSYLSGKCQGNLKFFKVRELSGNFIICQRKLNFC